MPDQIVKRVRRHGESYDLVKTTSGKLERRPADVAAARPAAKPRPDPDAPVGQTLDTKPSA